jgi:hypothetical protein
MDLFAMNFDDFSPQPDFFPFFPVWQGKCRQLGQWKMATQLSSSLISAPSWKALARAASGK